MENENEWQTIFSTGTHKAADGEEYTYTENDLDTIATKYNSQDAHEAPIVIGHPKNDAPAMGWVEGLKRVGDKLQAKYRQVDSDFKTAVNSGRFKKVSIALYPDLLLRHVGLFGAGIPAIKSLGNHKFQEGVAYSEFETEYAEIEIPIINNQENKIFNNEGKINMTSEEAKTLLTWAEGESFTPEQISSLTAELHKIVDAAAKPVEPKAPAETPPMKSEFSETTEYKTMMAEKEASDKRIMELENKQADAEFSEAYNELIQKGKCTPAQKELYKKAYDNMDKTKVVEFSEGGTTIATPAQNLIFKLIESMPKIVEFEEFAGKNRTDATTDLDAQTKWIKEHDKNNKQGK